MAKRIRTHSEDKELVKERRKHIVERSIPVFVKKGYARTTVDDLLKACGMGRGTIYHYIGSKDDVVYLIVNDLASKSQDVFNGLSSEIDNLDAAEALRMAMTKYFRLCDELQDAIMFAGRETLYLSARDRKDILDSVRRDISFFEEILKRGIQAGEFKAVNARVIAHDIIELAQTWAMRRWFLAKEVTLEQYIEENIELILGAVRVLPGETRVLGV